MLNYFWIILIRATKNFKLTSEKKNKKQSLTIFSRYWNIKWQKSVYHSLSVYRKLKFSGLFSYFDIFIPRGYDFNLVSPSIFFYNSIWRNMELFHKKILLLKEILEKIGHDNKFFYSCLRTFLNKVYSKKVP